MASPQLLAKAKQLFPNATDDELLQAEAQIRQKAPNATDDEILDAASKIAASKQDGSFDSQLAAQPQNFNVQDPLVRQKLKEKYFSDQYSDQAFKDAQAKADQEKGKTAWLQALAGFGGAVSGRGAAQAMAPFQKIRDEIQDRNVGQLERNKQKALQDLQSLDAFDKSERTARDDAYAQEQLKRERDPNSDESKQAQALAAKMGMKGDLSKLTAERFKAISPLTEKMYEVDQKRLDRQDALALRQAEKDRDRQDKKDKEAKLSEKQVEGINDFDDSVQKMQAAVAALGDHSEWTGAIDGRIPDRLIGSDQVAFRSAVGRMQDAYRKLITGAGASNQELARLESRLPSPTDNYDTFKSKAKSFIEEVQRAKASHLNNYSKVGKNVDAFKDVPSNSPAPQKIRVSNGKETRLIDPTDLKDAEADGYKQV